MSHSWIPIVYGGVDQCAACGAVRVDAVELVYWRNGRRSVHPSPCLTTVVESLIDFAERHQGDPLTSEALFDFLVGDCSHRFRDAAQRCELCGDDAEAKR
jgi:hypothetical protein